MNIIELAGFAFALSIGLFIGALLSIRLGWIGWVIGIPLGHFGTASIIWCFFRTVAWLWHSWSPLHPPCRAGKCKQNDYEITDLSLGGAVVLACKCGEKYMKILNRFLIGEQFLDILEDGSTRPYMKLSRFFRWMPDSRLTASDWRYEPGKPPCRSGRCQDKDYQSQGLHKSDKGVVVGVSCTCRCGDRYLIPLPPEYKFQFVMPDGATRPYMKRENGRWVPDV